MTGPTFRNPTQWRLSLGLVSILALTACDENGEFALPAFGGTDVATATAAPASNSTELVERDVEAPDVFQVTDEGLWDGRPSLGGVWVAHPDATDPERVIIRNSANGKFVIGALFRRERANPGPELQVSSDAAEALGLLAGAPATVNVTALRREEPPVAAAADATTDFDVPTNIAATALDPIEGAAAAIATAEAAAPAFVAAPAPAPVKEPSSKLAKPFIQIGIFSIEANARRTAERLNGAGMPARALAQSSQGRDFWRVIVGPAQSETRRASDLTKVKTLGFNDAYFVTN